MGRERSSGGGRQGRSLKGKRMMGVVEEEVEGVGVQVLRWMNRLLRRRTLSSLKNLNCVNYLSEI